MEEINEINLKILSKIKDMSSLEIANAIMTRVSPLPNFIRIAKDNYSSEIQPLKNVQQVNKWCDIKTHGKITQIIEELKPNIFMIILNAVYFKGVWISQFNKQLTSIFLFW